MVNRTTKIIATIGPAALDPDIFKQLVFEGIDYARINTKYGNYEQYDQIIQNIAQCKDIKSVPILFDIITVDSLSYALQHDITMIALSFAKDAQHVKSIRAIIPDSFLIAKIETDEGLDNFEEILNVSDGIMVARGDMARDVPMEKIPLLQKQITYQTLKKKKFLITATEMLLSMTHNLFPTRAEASDIANAVLDGSSAVMLSEETAIGKYPVESVRFMRRVIEETEYWQKNNLLKSRI